MGQIQWNLSTCKCLLNAAKSTQFHIFLKAFSVLYTTIFWLKFFIIILAKLLLCHILVLALAYATWCNSHDNNSNLVWIIRTTYVSINDSYHVCTKVGKYNTHAKNLQFFKNCTTKFIEYVLNEMREVVLSGDAF